MGGRRRVPLCRRTDPIDSRIVRRFAMHRRVLLLASVLAPVALIRRARAATVTPFTEAAFQAAQAGNDPILVAIHASWCPICAKQRPILSQLEADPAFKSLAVFMVDFDT